MSEFESLSDSDWLDISSSRESDNESVLSADSDREEMGLMPLSRRSSVSVGSSREGDIDAWEGFVDDSGDEESSRKELGDRGPLTADIGEISQEEHDTQHDPVEEERVKEALDQSLISTLSASRSNTASAHNSIRDLGLSFPDPLTSSRDELNTSYNDASPSDTVFTSTDVQTDDVADAGEGLDGALTEMQPLYDPGLPSTPEVAERVIEPAVQVFPREKAEFDVVLYGSSSPIKWSFVQTLIEKILLISGRIVTGSSICTDKDIMFLHFERQIDNSFTIYESVAVHDRTDVTAIDAPVSRDPKRPSLAIVYLPSILDSLPQQHTLYLPVLLPSASSILDRAIARDDWNTLGIAKNKVARLTKDAESPIFDSESINEISQIRAHRLWERLVVEDKKRPMRTLSEHLRPAHAVTLFAFVSLVVGFGIHAGFRKTYTPTPTSTIPISANFWGMFGPEINRTSILPATTMARINTPIATSYPKDLSLSIYEPGTSSLAVSSQIQQAEVSVPAAEVISTTIPTKAEAEDTVRDIVVRPTTQLSVVQPEPSMSMTTPVPIAGPSGTKTSARVGSVFESISDALDLHVKSIRHDLDELVESLDELSRAILRETTTQMQQSKEKVKELCETVQYRHERAKGKAKELRKRGEVAMSFAGEQFAGRTDLAKKQARELSKTLVTSDAWRVYQAARVEWASMLKEKGGGGGDKARGVRGGKCGGAPSRKTERQQTKIFFSCADFLV